MYAKLVLRNAKRSVKDYLIYIVTMTICVTLFYSFLSISSSYYQPDIGSEYDFTMLSDGMKMAICAVTLVLLFLIRFVNNYMLRRRQKEFAIQSVMGMEQRTIGRLFFAETFVMGMISIGIGIFLGVFCSLSLGVGKEYTLFGMTLFDLFDFVTAKIMLPLGGFFISLFAGWYLDKRVLWEEITNRGTLKVRLYRLIVFILKFIAPIGIAFIFINELGLI